MHFIIDNFIVDKVSSLTSARGSLATVLITASLDAAGMGLVMPILPALLHEEGVTADAVPLNVGVLIALYAVMQFIFAPVLGTLSDRFGRRRVLLVSLAGATVDYLVLATTSALSVFYIARAVAGITGATNAVTATVIADITPPHQRQAFRFTQCLLWRRNDRGASHGWTVRCHLATSAVFARCSSLSEQSGTHLYLVTRDPS